MTESKKLSIVFITNNWFPFSAGVVSSINAFRNELKRQGHSVTLITLDFPGAPEEPEEDVIRVRCPLRFLYRGIPLAVPWRATAQIDAIIKELQPDIIHSHHPFLLGVSALKVAQANNIPCVFTYHSLYAKYTHYIPLPQHALKKLVCDRVRNYCQDVDGIITPGKETELLLERDGVSTLHILLPSPLQSIYVESMNRNSSGRTPRAGQRKPFHLMTCSRFVKEKNIPFLLDVFAALDQTNFRLTLAGFGNELEALRAYAYETLGLSPEVVHFAVKLEMQDLVELYHSADLFLFASLADTQGLVLAEAMSSGLPVVALDGPGQEDIIKNGINGFLVTSKVEMQTAIELVAYDPMLHQSLRSGALQTAQRYCPEQLTHKLIAFYSSLL